MRALIEGLLGRPRETVVVECRHCGANVGEDRTTCPVCERSEVATYELEG